MQIDFPNVSQNQLKKWSRLADVKFRREEGLFLAEGAKVVEELLKSDWQVEAVLVLPDKISHWQRLIERVYENLPVYQLKSQEWKKLSQDKEPEGIIAIVRSRKALPWSSWLQSAGEHVLIGHEISNPRNLGALMRSARWFGFKEIMLSANSVDVTHPKVIRASMGSIFHLTILTDVDLQTALPEIKRNFLLIGSDVGRGAAPRPPAKKAALLVGSESHGLPEDLLALADERWRIPGEGKADSLSLPQAAAIMMYEMTKKG
jgi:TrmH family RNA methyltransferase